MANILVRHKNEQELRFTIKNQFSFSINTQIHEF